MASQESELIEFKGPANEVFPSLNDQALHFLNCFWSNWNVYEKPKSYLLPPIFKYKHADVSDTAVDKYEERHGSTKRNGIINHRSADRCEKIAYSAIHQLIEDKIATPFLAVHSFDFRLNLNQEKFSGNLIKIFSNFD
jgi:hypothetical protein